MLNFWRESFACKVVERKKLPEICLIEKIAGRVFTVRKLAERSSVGAWLC